jgi:hypothetical protein
LFEKPGRGIESRDLRERSALPTTPILNTLFGFYPVSSGAPVLGGLYMFKLKIENIARGCRVSSLFAADPVAVCTHVDCADGTICDAARRIV